MRLAVVGTGYIGLVEAAGFAKYGHKVVGIDVNEEVVRKLNNGDVHIHEPGLEELVKHNLEEGRLSFTTSFTPVRDSHVTFLAVPTPTGPGGGLYDGKYIFSAAESAARELANAPGHPILAVRSTVNLGIYRRVEEIVAQIAPNADVVSNPEFSAQGTAVKDFLQPNRVVLGARQERALEKMRALYGDFTHNDKSKIKTGRPGSAVLAKRVSNLMLSFKIAMTNQIAQAAPLLDADMLELREMVGSDSRIGNWGLYASPGYGGSCFRKDVEDLCAELRGLGHALTIAEASLQANKEHKLYMPKLMDEYFGGLEGKTIALWGLAFKARTDDMRDSSAIDVLDYILSKPGTHVRAHDIEAMPRAQRDFLKHHEGRITYVDHNHDALHGADALLVLTEWEEYKHPDVQLVKERLSDPVIFDARNWLNPKEIREAGIKYIGMGLAEPDIDPEKIRASWTR